MDYLSKTFFLIWLVHAITKYLQGKQSTAGVPSMLVRFVDAKIIQASCLSLSQALTRSAFISWPISSACTPFFYTKSYTLTLFFTTVHTQ